MKDKIIEYFVNKGIEITIGKHKDYGIYYDLQTGMKSHCYLVFKENSVKVHTRYNEPVILDTSESILMDHVINEICWNVKDCLCGRDYMSSYWADILVESGMLTRHIETKVTYS